MRRCPRPAVVAVVLLALIAPAGARAVTLTVQNANDAFAGSLRQQVLDSAPGDTIRFAPAVWGLAINLTSGEIAVPHTLTILGPQQDLVFLQGTNASRILNHTAGNLTLVGIALGSGQVDGAGLPGGLILSNAAGSTLEIDDCFLSSGRASAGGLLNSVGTALVLKRCTLGGGVATSTGGAIAYNGSLNATDCLFRVNSSGTGGGAIFAFGTMNLVRCTVTQCSAAAVVQEDGAGALVDCTLAGNTASIGCLFNVSTTNVTLRNTIVAANGSGGIDVNGNFTSLGYNMIGDKGGATGLGLAGSHDQVGTSGSPLNPGLGPLQENGGPTQTMAPNPGSLAIDQGHASSGAVSDARGHVRTYDNPAVVNANAGDGTDVGSVEAGPATRFQVTNLLDDGPGSLRQATITAAAGDSVTFRSDLAGTIPLTSGEIQLKRGFVVFGPGPNTLTLDGKGFSPAIRVYPDAGNARVMGLRLIHGASPACVWVQNGASLAMDLAEITDSKSSGILNEGVLSLSRSLVARCNASPADGGGLENHGSATVTNCTFAADSARAGGAIQNAGTLVVRSSTLVGNVALYADAGAVGGGGLSDGISASLTSSIVAGNTSPAGGPDISGGVTSGGYNLVGKIDGAIGLTNGVNHDQVGSAASPLLAQLGSLADNGGPTATLLPLPGSPAIDKGLAGALDTDQRERNRRFDDGAVANASGGDASDVGACERGAGTVDVPLPAAPMREAIDRIDAVEPNPSLAAWAVRFTLGRGGAVDLALFDVAGRRVAGLAHGDLPPGSHVVAADGATERLPAGVYWLRLATPAGTTTRRVVRVR